MVPKGNSKAMKNISKKKETFPPEKVFYAGGYFDGCERKT